MLTMQQILEKILIIAALALFCIGVANAENRQNGGRNLHPDNRNGPGARNEQQARGNRERHWRRGRHQGARGNERSERPSLPARMGHPQRDRNQDNDDRRQGNFRDGCPNGTVSAAMAADNLSFSLIFDQFIAQTRAGEQGRDGRTDVVRCNIVVPIDIPDGMRMSITSIDYRGFAQIPAGAAGELRSSYNFMGSRQRGGGEDTVGFNFQFAGPLTENYTLSSDAFTERSAVSGCGGQAQLRIGNLVRLRSRANEDAQLSIDSVDGQGQLVYFVNWERCQ